MSEKELAQNTQSTFNDDELKDILQAILNTPMNNQSLYNLSNYRDNVYDCEDFINAGGSCTLRNTSKDGVLRLSYNNQDENIVLDKINLSPEIQDKLAKQLININFHMVEINANDDDRHYEEVYVDLRCFVEFKFKETTKTYFTYITQEIDNSYETETIRYTIDSMADNFD